MLRWCKPCIAYQWQLTPWTSLRYDRYFGKNKLVFFQNQLSLHGFQHITTGRDANCYYHPLFLRGRQDLVQSWKKVKTGLLFPNQDEQPDFYKMEPSPCPKAHAQYLNKAIEQAKKMAQEEDLSTKPTNFGPLRVPGRLLYQSTETPTSLRFVKTHSTVFQRRRTESRRWRQPIQLKEISKQLEHHCWNQENSSSSSSLPAQAPKGIDIPAPSSIPKPTLNDLIQLLE